MENVIFYTDRLWRSLARPPRARRREAPAAAGRLAPWSATLTHDEDPNYVVAVAAHSGLTLVFRATSVDDFRPAMADALRRVFADLDLPEDLLAIEIDDVLTASFERLRDSHVREELDYVEGISGTEFPYHSDVGRVQLNLNELPRSRTPSLPTEGARVLFTGPREAIVAPRVM